MGEVEQDVQRRRVITGRHVSGGAALLIEVIRHLAAMKGMRVDAWPIVLDVVILTDRCQDRLQHHSQYQRRQDDYPGGRAAEFAR